MKRPVGLFNIAAFAGMSLAFLRDPGCGGVDSGSGEVNSPCTRDKDCGEHLKCAQGVCEDPDEPDAEVPKDAGADSVAKDADRDGD